MSWKDEESGGLDEFTAVVEDAWFEEGEYGTQLVLLNKLDDAPEWMEGGTNKAYFSIGNGWETFDGGKTVEDPNKPGRVFNKQTKIRRLINRCIEIGAADTLESRGVQTEAASWVGLRFEWKSEPGASFVDRVTKEKVQGREVALPVKFLGVAEQKALPLDEKKPAKKKPAKDAGGISADDLVRLQVCKDSANGDFEKFVELVLGDPEMISNSEIVGGLTSKEGLWTSLA